MTLPVILLLQRYRVTKLPCTAASTSRLQAAVRGAR